MLFPSFRYHNEPEGKDLKNKISSLVRIGGMFGMYRATTHLIYDHTRTSWKFLECANIFAGAMAFPMAAGFTYATVRYALTNIRNKDDSWNCFIAGAVNAPLVYGMLTHRLHNQSRILVLLPIFCGLAAISFEHLYQYLDLDNKVQQGSKFRGLGVRPPTYSTYKLE